jgi:alpha-amylase
MKKNSFILLIITVGLFFSNCKNEKKETMAKKSEIVDLKTPEWVRNANIYEVNIRQYSKEGTIKAFQKHLPRLKAMGVDILWLMPIYPICEKDKKCDTKSKGKCLGSPYAVYDFEAVNPDFGSTEDFKSLVDSVHALGMKVILDFVPDHTGWDSKWMKEKPEYFKKVDGKFTVPIDPKTKAATDWTDVAMLDYDNPATRKAVIDAHLFWIKNYNVDGFREDVAGFVPSSFWKELRLALDPVKNVFMLSEWEDVVDHFDVCFEANYGWHFHHLIKEIAKAEKPASALDEYLIDHRKRYNARGYHMLFTQNHDENTWNGTLKESFGDGADAFTVLAHTFDGLGLIYSGQESDLDHRLSLFNKDEIKWGTYPKTQFFTKLLDLKKRNKALWNGLNGGFVTKIKTTDDKNVYAFIREKDGNKVVAIFNFSKMPVDFTLQGDSFVGTYSNVYANSSTSLTKDMIFKMQPWDYLVFSNK